MTHQDCQDRLLDLAYGELGVEETAEMQTHLASCETCRAELARLGGTRVAMRQLEPEPPPEHGEHLLLTAARHAVERRQERRTFRLSSWAWRWSLTVAALAVVGTVSFRILSVRDRPLSREIEGRPETFAARAQKAAPTVAEAPAPSAAEPVAETPKPPAAPPQPAPADMAKTVAPEKARQFALAPPKDESRKAEVSASAGQVAASPQPPAMRSEQAPASTGSIANVPQRDESVAESPQQSAGQGLVSRRSAANAKEAIIPAERQVQAEAEASRDQLAGDSGFAQPPPVPATAQGDSTAASHLRALGTPTAKPAPAPLGEEKLKKSEAPKPLADSIGASEEAAMDKRAQAPGSEPSHADDAARERATPTLAFQSPAEPPPATPEVPLLTAKTWQRDRRVRAVQKLVQEIDEAQRQRRLNETSRPFQACGTGEDAERRLFALEGRTVKYVRQKGYRDLALTIEQLYDRQGHLRYVFIHGGAVNGAVVDHRLWLDEEGRRLWEAQKWRRGRYPLPEVWPDKDLTPQAPGPAALECGAP